MSHAHALPGERFSSGIARRWIVACMVSQAICLAALTAGAILAQRMQWLTHSPEKIALNLAIAAIFALTFGYLRGKALREALGRFPMRLWCLAAAAVALLFTSPEARFVFDITPWSRMSAILNAISPVVTDGLIYGLVVGGIEALVMRRTAFGLTVWVLLSGFTWAIAFAIASLGFTFTFNLLVPPLGFVASHALWSLLAAPVAALLTLPALRNLTPQLSYYGPRVYRPLLRR